MEGYLIIIPYLPSAAQGRELELAIAGWRKHFKEKHHIIVVGQGLPHIEGDDVTCVESRRMGKIAGQYRQHLDYVKCFDKVHKLYPDTEGFVFVADDCYATNDFTIDDVKSFKKINDDIIFAPNTTNSWQKDKLKTKQALLNGHYPTRNYTTHLPQWYEWDKLTKLWDDYQMFFNSYVMEDLYYNIYHCYDDTIMLDRNTDNIKYGIYEEQPNFDDIREAFKSKIWITNSPVGWSEELEKLLLEHYGIK